MSFSDLLEEARDGDFCARSALYGELRDAVAGQTLTAEQAAFLTMVFDKLQIASDSGPIMRRGSSDRLLKAAKAHLLFIMARGSRTRSEQRRYGRQVAEQVTRLVNQGWGSLAACQEIADRRDRSLRQIQRYYYQWRNL